MTMPRFTLSGFTLKQKVLLIPAAILAIYVSTPFQISVHSVHELNEHPNPER